MSSCQLCLQKLSGTYIATMTSSGSILIKILLANKNHFSSITTSSDHASKKLWPTFKKSLSNKSLACLEIKYHLAASSSLAIKNLSSPIQTKPATKNSLTSSQVLTKSCLRIRDSRLTM